MDKPTPIFDLALVIEEWYRQGPAFVDERRVEIVSTKGPVFTATFDEYDAGYPYRKGWKLMIVPTTETEVIIAEVTERDDTVDPPIYKHYYLVYLRGFGWWRFENSDAVKVPVSKPSENIINRVLENLMMVEA